MGVLKRFTYIGVILGLCSQVSAFGLWHHMWLGMKTMEIWQEFDPAFYTALTTDHPYFEDPWGRMTRKMYYIGLTLPDMLSEASRLNNSLSILLTKLYERKDTTIWWGQYPIDIYLVRALDIFNQTKSRVQSPLPLITDAHDFEVLREMLLYARDSLPDFEWPPNGGWSIPKEVVKALIYGAYMHVIHDFIAHQVFQPANFGYGYVVEADSAEDYPLLHAASNYHSLFTDTYMTSGDTSFIAELFRGHVGVNLPGMIYPGKMEFYSEWTDGWDGGWQDVVFAPSPHPIQGSIFYALNWFVYIGQMKGYFDPNESTGTLLEQLGSYLHGWAISLFLLSGYRESYEDIGGLVFHPYWTGDDVLDFWVDLINENISANCPQPGYGGVVINFIIQAFRMLIAKEVFKRKLKENLPFDWDLVGSRVWTTLFQNAENLDFLWGIIPDSLKTDTVRQWYHDLRRILTYWESYSSPSFRVPSYRSCYRGELQKSLNFEFYYSQSLDEWFELPVISEISLKSGVLGGVYELPETTYYYQPGVIKLHFERSGDLVYTVQDIPAEGADPTYIDLKYDLVTFGGTKVLVRAETGDTLASTTLSGPSRHTGTLTFNAQDAVNNGVC